VTRAVVVGPTASGKSDVALAAARASGDVELVAVDAMQVYRGMDIGTAKPTAAERAEVPHHCLDLVDPGEEFTLADYQAAERAAETDVATRGRRVLLVGGTGLYLRAVLDGLELPGQWPELRAELEAEALVDLPGLRARLAGLDPVAAGRMEPTNARRIVRALEVCLGSGRPFSSFGPGLDTYPASPVTQIGLRWTRPLLAERIERRVHAMMAAGLLDEVRRLVAGPVPLSRTACQALGYKELLDHLEGRCGLDEAVATIVVRTRQFAVRQDRWFRRDPRIRWIDMTTGPADALPALLEALRP
jgi:tRNA dimethylallyltransferase